MRGNHKKVYVLISETQVRAKISFVFRMSSNKRRSKSKPLKYLKNYEREKIIEVQSTSYFSPGLIGP